MARGASFVLRTAVAGVLAGTWAAGIGGNHGPQPAQAATPESPEVRQMVEKALGYLENASEHRLGGKCLIGLAFLKNGHGEEHPQIASAVAACQAATRGGAPAVREDIYSTGIAIIFLCELDPSKYRDEIEALLKSLELRQKEHGGWGYPDRGTGDTSMTQYGVLSTWEAAKHGFVISQASVEAVANWLLRTQDPGGGWGYQGKDPGADSSGRYTLVQQSRVQLGVSAAGLGCTYIVADLLGATPIVERDPDLPPALMPVRAGDQPGQGWKSEAVSLSALRRAQQRGVNWMRSAYRIDPPGFTHYYLYALERFQSFAEASEGRVVPEPRWYNDGVRYLKTTQQPDGHWASKCGAPVDTAFGVLFLVRSTKKSIERAKSFDAGTLAGASGLPRDLREARLRQGRIVGPPPETPLESLLDVLAGPITSEFRELAADPAALAAQIRQAPPAEREAALGRLRDLARRGIAPARIAALQTLGHGRDLDSVPVMIAALNSADVSVSQAADEALRWISRQVTPSESLAAAQHPQAVQRWKHWYQSIRPDATWDE